MLSLRSFGSTVECAGPSAGAKLCPPPDARASHTEMKWTGVIIGIIQSTFSVYGGEKYKTQRTELCKVGVNQNDCNMCLCVLCFSCPFLCGDRRQRAQASSL